MNTILRPETAAVLAKFAERRRHLILIRGVCVLLAVLFGGFIALALVDKQILIADEIRWGVSGVIYAAALFFSWVTSFRYLFGARGQRDTARLLETEAPQLHEELLSAVELGQVSTAEAQKLDSAAFRSALQDHVAVKASALKVRSVLPLSRIGKWLGLAAIAFLTAISLSFVPGMKFLQFFTRAALPVFDFERPSDVIITIVTPETGTKFVPAGETVQVAVELEGERPNKVLIETREPNGNRAKMELRRETGARYTGAINVGRDNVRFRIQAGTSLTKFRELVVRPRPAIDKFVKTYTAPAYSGLPVKEVTEEHGDLTALEGTKVRLQLKPNQTIANGELRVFPKEGDAKPKVFPLEFENGNIYAEVDVNSKNGTYEVALESTETGFKNEFRPQYAINATPDAAPIVTLIQPLDTLDVKRDDAVAFRGKAEDDIKVAKIERSWSVNGGKWFRALVSEPNAKETPFSSDWELAPAKFKTNDVVLVKFVATDNKGNEGESELVRLIVVADPTRDEERKWAKEEAKLAAETKNAVQASQELAKALQEGKEALKKDEKDRNANEQQKVERLEQALAKTKDATQKAWEAAKEAVREAPGKTETQEMQALGEKIARALSGRVEELEQRIHADQKDPAIVKKQQERALENVVNEISGGLQQPADQAKTLAAEDAAKVAAEDLKHAAEQTAKATDPVKNLEKATPEDATHINEKLDTALARAKTAEQQLNLVKQTTDGGDQNNVQESLKRMNEAGKKIAEDRQDAAKAKELPGAVEQLKQKVEESKRNTEQLAKDLARKGEEVRKDLLGENQKIAEREKALQEAKWKTDVLANELAQADQQKKAKEAAKQDATPSPEQTKKIEAAKANANEAIAKAADEARRRAELMEQHQQAKAKETVDNSRLSRALDALADKATEAGNADEGKQVREQLEKLDQAAKTLNADNEASDLAQNLAEMSRKETSSTGKDDTAKANPQDWQAAKEDLKVLPKALEKAQAPQEAKDAANKAANTDPAKNVAEEMKRREQQPDQAQPSRATAANLDAVRQQVEEAKAKLAPKVDDARKMLAEAAPEVKKMMRDLAKKADEQAKKDQALAEQAGAPPLDKKADEAAKPNADKPNTEQAKANTPDGAKPDADPAKANTPDGQKPATDPAAQVTKSDPANNSDKADSAKAGDKPNADPAKANTPDAAQPNQGDKPAAPKATPEQVAADAGKLVPEAKKVEDKLGKVMDALRQETAAANLQDTSERNAAKAADTALAQLNTEQPKAAEALKDAAKTDNAEKQAKDLTQAAKQEKQLATSLDQLAKNLEKAAEGGEMAKNAANEADQAAKDLGVDKPLNSAYDRAAELAKMLDAADKKSPEAMLQQLEQELDRNPAMRKALDQIANQASQQAANDLNKAEQKENQLAQQLNQQAAPNPAQPNDAGQAQQKAQEQKALTDQVKQSAGDLERAARHEQRLGDKKQAEQLAKTGEQVNKVADKEMTEATKALQENKEAGKEAQATQQADGALKQELQQAGLTPQDPKTGDQAPTGDQAKPGDQGGQPQQGQGEQVAQNQPGQGQGQGKGQPGHDSTSQMSGADQKQGQDLAQALDQLDQAMHDGANSPAAQQAMAQAQAAMSQAMQNQQGSMAQARAQGNVPGQQPGKGQGKGKGEGESKANESESGNYADAKKNGEALPDAPKKLNTDWGHLPTKVAEDMMEGQRQGMSSEYRGAIEQYYKAIAEKARSK